jgi:hypothetical protein
MARRWGLGRQHGKPGSQAAVPPQPHPRKQQADARQQLGGSSSTHRHLRGAQVPAAHVAVLLQVVGGHAGALDAAKVLQLEAIRRLQEAGGAGGKRHSSSVISRGCCGACKAGVTLATQQLHLTPHCCATAANACMHSWQPGLLPPPAAAWRRAAPRWPQRRARCRRRRSASRGAGSAGKRRGSRGTRRRQAGQDVQV